MVPCVHARVPNDVSSPPSGLIRAGLGGRREVIEIAADFLAHGSSVEEMAIQFPSLTPSMIHSALAYYYDHREEYEETLTASLNSCREKAEATMDSPIRMCLGKVSARP